VINLISIRFHWGSSWFDRTSYTLIHIQLIMVEPVQNHCKTLSFGSGENGSPQPSLVCGSFDILLGIFCQVPLTCRQKLFLSVVLILQPQSSSLTPSPGSWLCSLGSLPCPSALATLDEHIENLPSATCYRKVGTQRCVYISKSLIFS
jgi:hypothetical protein